MTIRIIRRPAVQQITGLSRSTIYKGMAEGVFPRPVKIGPRAIGWVEAEVHEWIESRLAHRARG